MEEIDLKELFQILWEKKIWIIIITLLFAFLGLAYTETLVVPKYRATTKLLLATDSSNSDSSTQKQDTITTTEVAINSNLVSTYSELVKSNKIIRQVISNLRLNASEGAIRNSVTVTAVSDTEVIQISVMNEDPDLSAKIANEIAKVFIESVKEFYGIENVHIVDEAEPSYAPANINHIKDVAIFTFFGIVVSAVYAFISYLLDTSVKSAEDIEKATGVAVLVSIPLYEVDNESSKKKRKEANK